MDPQIPRDDTAAPNQRGKALLGGLGMAAVSAALGYVCGLVRGEGNEILLAVCFGTAGALVGLLGYGWIVAMFAGLAHVFACCRPRGKQAAVPSGTESDTEPEEW
jgi:hypothetical protein